MSQITIRNPGHVVDQIIETAKRHNIYKGKFKTDIDELNSSINFASPELLKQPHFFLKLYHLMCDHFPEEKHKSKNYYFEFVKIIKGY